MVLVKWRWFLVFVVVVVFVVVFVVVVSLFVTGPLMDEFDYLRRFDCTQF